MAAAPSYVLGAPLGSSLNDAVQLVLSVGADNGRLGDASPGLTAVILVRIFLLSTIGEELLFRGALFTWLRRRLPAAWTILITGVALGAMHQSPTFLPLAILVGNAAGWIREITGSTSCAPSWSTLVQNVIVVLASLAATGWHTPAVLG